MNKKHKNNESQDMLKQAFFIIAVAGIVLALMFYVAKLVREDPKKEVLSESEKKELRSHFKEERDVPLAEKKAILKDNFQTSLARDAEIEQDKDTLRNNFNN